jgi:AraC-like DNA-binding protein
MTLVMPRAMSATDQQLTDLDLLAEGVFGGPLPPPRRVRAIVGDATRLVAVQADSLPTAPPRCRWLRIHPGIGYLLWHGPSPLPSLLLSRDAVVGESQPTSAGLVHAVQQALVSLRRRELATLARRHAAPPTFARECEARALLIGRLRGGSDWSEAWACWSDIVLLRHQNQINAVRRKLIEVLALATRDIDRAEALSWPFRACIDAIYATYALMPLMQTARAGLAGIAPLLGRPPAAAPPATLRKALRWVEERLDQPLSLRDAAHAVGVSSEHLARQARASLGVSFLNHLTAMRLTRARRMLAEDDAAVQDIATRCGFRSTEHFHRLFKRHTGSSPGRWRGDLRHRAPTSNT